MNTEKMHFKIFGEQTGKVLDASLSNAGEVVLWESNGGDNQLWYWDGIDRDILRNKMFPNKVIRAIQNQFVTYIHISNHFDLGLGL